MKITLKTLLFAVLVAQAAVFADYYGRNVGRGVGNVVEDTGYLASDAVRAPFTLLGAPARNSDYRRSSWRNRNISNDEYRADAFRDTMN